MTLFYKKVFSKLDFSDAFFQHELDNYTKKLFIIMSSSLPNRLQLGVKTTPSSFQQFMDTMLFRLDGTLAYIDSDQLLMKDVKLA